MATTYTLISSNVLTGSAASVTFSSIPSTYTDLVLKISARTDEAGATTSFGNITFNSVGGTSYSGTKLTGTGSAASSGNLSNSASLDLGVPWVGSTATANTFANDEFYIPSYTASQNKPVGIITMTENNTTASYITDTAGLFRNTAAISSISINALSCNFISGSSFYLYGIKNS